MRCLLYRLYDAWKTTALASRLNYGGQRFQHFGPIEITGTVQACAHNAGDGDRCFDVESVEQEPHDPRAWSINRWHCEVTPCAPQELRNRAATLHIGMTVRVTGTRTYDPNHHIGPKHFKGGGWEVHPVSGIEILT